MHIYILSILILMCTNRVFIILIIIFEVSYFSSWVTIICTCLYTKETYYTYIYILSLLDTHRGKGRTTFYIPNSFLHICIILIASLVYKQVHHQIHSY